MLAPTIFQIEDNEDLSFFMECAIEEINSGIRLASAPNGSDALVTLNNYQENNIVPGMILLDINLPGLSGIDLLKVIREIPLFSAVPVVVFSTSDNPRDIKMALEYGANEFQVKPLGYRALVNTLKILYAKYINSPQ